MYPVFTAAFLDSCVTTDPSARMDQDNTSPISQTPDSHTRLSQSNAEFRRQLVIHYETGQCGLQSLAIYLVFTAAFLDCCWPSLFDCHAGNRSARGRAYASRLELEYTLGL